MKKLLTVLACMMFFFACGCGAASQEQDTISSAAEVVEVKKPEIGEEAGIEDIIIPFYLPQKLYDGKKVQQSSLSKSGDKAVISAGGTVLVELYYTEDVRSFPELGKAEITAQGGGYTLKMRLNSKTACTLKSTGISREELIKVADSFYMETGPAPESARLAAGKKLEGNHGL